MYSDKSSSYKKLLERDGSVSIYREYVQAFAIEMFKNLNGMSLEMTKDLFVQRIENHYNVRDVNDFNIPYIRTVYHGIESLSYSERKVWDIVPERFRKTKSLNSFKEPIKKWKSLDLQTL